MKTGVSEVVYDTAADQHFTVIIPKKIVLGSDKTAEYDVTVKGDVAQGSKVKVEPQDDVEDVEGINFVMEATKSGGSKNVDVTQAEEYWNYVEIVANDYEGTEKPGNIDGSELTFGMWQGNLTFLINFEDEYGEKSNDVGEIEEPVVGNIEDWEYTLNESKNTVTLNKYIGKSLDVKIHSKYDVNGTVYEARLPYTAGYMLFNKKEIKSKIQSITFDYDFDTSNVGIMEYMFSKCSSLRSLDLSMFDTSKVKNMNGMFENCSSLRSLNLSSFDISNVTTMSCMFDGCSSLQSVDLSSFDTSNLNYSMSALFRGCSSLQSLDLSNFDTSNVPNIGEMFKGCSSLQSLDLRSFDTSNVTNMASIFEDCSSLQSIKVSSKWVTEQMDYTNGKENMFKNCGTDHVTYVE